MIKATDGDKFENARSLNQELTFHSAEQEFAARNVLFGDGQQRTLKLISADGIYTNLALLLSDQCVHTIKLAVFQGGEKEVFRDRMEFTGSLLAQMNETYARLDQYNRVHAEVKGLYRVDTRDYPEEALREALFNALVHREYSLSGSTLISVFDDRIEFMSLGGLVPGITLNDILFGVSLSRNENLANVFYRLGLIEAYGTGIPKMMRSYAGHHAQPAIEVSDNAFKITLPNRNTKKADPIAGEQEKKVLELFDANEFIVRKEIEDTLGISQSTATRLIRDMLGTGLLLSKGGGKNIRYYHPSGRTGL
jgi:ATP-dependent DNA helicase RecG